MALTWGNSINSFNNTNKITTIDAAKETQKIIDMAGDDIKRFAEDGTPVDTGLLQASWRKKKGPGIPFQGRLLRSVVITNDTPYAGFVEFGTIHMAPRRMFQKALIKADRIKQRRLKELEKRLAKLYRRV